MLQSWSSKCFILFVVHTLLYIIVHTALSLQTEIPRFGCVISALLHNQSEGIIYFMSLYKLYTYLC